MKLPDSLKKGDIIRLITPSGAIEETYVSESVPVLSEWGYICETAQHALERNGRFAGTIRERMEDLKKAFLDPEVKAVLCTRGGYGVVHLLAEIEPEIIRNNPKWLIGFSDITALHALSSYAGVISMHAPMCKHLAETKGTDLPSLEIKGILQGELPEYDFPHHSLSLFGEAEGTLIGGNLAVFCGLRGTCFDSSQFIEDPILFIEDIGERPYQIDRMIYNLELGGVFSKIKALLVGQFTDCVEDPLMYDSILASIRKITEKYNIPVIFDFPTGHVDMNRPLLCGAKVRISGSKMYYV